MAATEKPLYHLTVHEAQELIRRKALSPVELTRALIGRIEATDGKLHAYLKLTPERALEEARLAEAEIQKGNYRGPLHGIPLAVKDQLDLKGLPARIRRRDSQAAEATEDATAVRKLREAGVVMLGKLMMSSLPEELPQPRNPWDPGRVTGGSSTGSGAAVAAGLCLAALGEDTAGSIRNPASLCGIVGLKPTYGRVSRHGLAPLGWSLDTCGPMTWVVEDAAYVLQAIAGYDPRDPTSVNVPVPDYSAALNDGLKGTIVGVPRSHIEKCQSHTDTEILALVEKAIGEMTALGARIEEVSIPTLEVATIANAVIYYNEHYAAHRKENRDLLKNGGTARRARIYLGLLTNSSDYIQAQRIRSRLRRECAEIFHKVDILALPGQAAPAPAFEETGPLDILFKHLAPDFLAPFNLAGLPAMNVPCAFTRANLPVALQLAGKPFDEATVLRAGRAFQRHVGLHERRPPI